MKKYLIFCFIVATLNIYPQAWTLLESHEFNSTTGHDSQWHNGWNWWALWDHYPGCSGGPNQIPAPIKVFPHNSKCDPNYDSYNTDPVETGPGNSNIVYTTVGSRNVVCLKITSVPNNIPYPTECPTLEYDYKSAVLWSKQNNYSHGKYEICCKFPAGNKSVGGGLWLYSNVEPINGGGDGEIDIVEIANMVEQIATTEPYADPSLSLHGWSVPSVPHFSTKSLISNMPLAADKFDPTADFHVYTFEWTPKYIKLKIDGKLRFMLEKSEAYYFPTGNLSLIASVGLYPCLGAPNNPDPNNFPLNFYIDYIRVYTEACPSHVLCDNSLPSNPQNVDGYDIDLAVPDDASYETNHHPFTASCETPTPCTPPSGSDNIGCPKTVNNTNKLFTQAENIITMHPGFSADGAGSSSVTFSAVIVPCSSQRPENTNGIVDKASVSLQNVKINPNPGTGIYDLLFQEEDTYTIRVFDINGALQKEIQFRGKQQEVNIGELKAGIYFFRVTDSNSYNQTIKVIKM